MPIYMYTIQKIQKALFVRISEDTLVCAQTKHVKNYTTTLVFRGVGGRGSTSNRVTPKT